MESNTGINKSKRKYSDKTREKNREREKKRQKESRKKIKENNKDLENLKMENKKLIEELESKNKLIVEFKENIDQLSIKIQNQLEYISNLENKVKFSETIVQNTKQLISELPFNSPFRRPLLFFFLQNIDKEYGIELYKISNRTYDRVMEDDGTTLVEQKYAINVERERISETQKEEIKKILDDILPIQSGRKYRYQEQTDDWIYQQYVVSVQNGNAVSKTFFIYNILAKELIHHSKTPKFCPICDDTNESMEQQKHKDLVKIQRSYYQIEKKEISSNSETNKALVTQDFTQLQLDGTFVQNLVICKYTYQQNAKDGLKREYKHFVGKSTDSNGISFVTGCWKILIDSNWFENNKKISIWSDGGPKHFKITSNMKFLLAIQHHFSNIDWVYNFFPSYHGCSICDGAAAHVKNKINQTMRNEHISIKTTQQTIDTINELQNHEAFPARITQEDLSANTFKGIKKYHKFIADKRKKIIYAFENSSQTKSKRKYQPQDFVKYEELTVE